MAKDEEVIFNIGENHRQDEEETTVKMVREKIVKNMEKGENWGKMKFSFKTKAILEYFKR